MKKFRNYLLVIVMLIMLPGAKALAHCEVPCGIYEDEMRIEMIREDITTITKSIENIQELAEKQDPQSMNQMVRWINTKEDHANKIQEIITQYFMTQRVKANPEKEEDQKKSAEQLKYLHEMLVYAMKMKQSLSMENIELFNNSMKHFEKAYFGENAHRHKPDGSHR